MRRSIKKIFAFASAAVLACGAVSLAACGEEFVPPTGVPQGDVVSNGGFIVEKGNTYYFINGNETYDSDNTYGTPVKGALMRAEKKTDGTWGKAETVIPSLMVTGSYNGGLFIYGDRIYYATPTNVKGIDGTVQNSYLDFMSASLDGRDRQDLVRVSSNATDYRFVEENGSVYLVYYDSSNTALHSYNTKTNTDVVLAEGLTSSPVFHKTDKGNTAIYYTMTVTDGADSDHPKTYSTYNQIYRVTAGTTKAPYNYEPWDTEWLNENNDGKIPYVNLGTIVLDGRGTNSDKTSKFNHSDATPSTLVGYNYTLRSFENGGIYFTRGETNMDTVGAGAALYYLSEEKLNAQSWDSVSGNGQLDLVANATFVDDEASENALYFIDKENHHHYLYVEGARIYRADVATDGSGEIATRTWIAKNMSGATLKYLDPVEGDDEYGYVYYSHTDNSKQAIYRAVYDCKDGIDQDYYKDSETAAAPGRKDNFAAVRILDVSYVSSWYDFELIGTDLFFAEDLSTYGASLDCVSCLSLSKDGKLMNNAQVKALDTEYNKIAGFDTTVFGKDYLFDDISEELGDDILSNAAKYYFYTGDRTLLDENREEYEQAIEAGTEEDLKDPYTKEIMDAFDKLVKGEEVTYNGNPYKMGKRSDYVTSLGVFNEADTETYNSYWQTSVLSKYTAPETEEESGLEGWEIALIVIACVLAVGAAAAVTAVVLLKKKKGENEPKRPLMHVDTTDDRDIDVYADDEPTPEDELVESYEAPAEELPSEEEAAPVEEPAVEEVAPEESAEQPSAEEEPASEEKTDGSEE